MQQKQQELLALVIGGLAVLGAAFFLIIQPIGSASPWMINGTFALGYLVFIAYHWLSLARYKRERNLLEEERDQLKQKLQNTEQERDQARQEAENNQQELDQIRESLEESQGQVQKLQKKIEELKAKTPDRND